MPSQRYKALPKKKLIESECQRCEVMRAHNIALHVSVDPQEYRYRYFRPNPPLSERSGLSKSRCRHHHCHGQCQNTPPPAPLVPPQCSILTPFAQAIDQHSCAPMIQYSSPYCVQYCTLCQILKLVSA